MPPEPHEFEPPDEIGLRMFLQIRLGRASLSKRPLAQPRESNRLSGLLLATCAGV